LEYEAALKMDTFDYEKAKKQNSVSVIILPLADIAGADNDKMVKVHVQHSEREYLARVLRHAKWNEGSKIDWIHLAERTSCYFIYLHLIVLFVSSIVIVLTVNILEWVVFAIVVSDA
jgi:cation transport ATPase